MIAFSIGCKIKHKQKITGKYVEFNNGNINQKVAIKSLK